MANACIKPHLDNGLVLQAAYFCCIEKTHGHQMDARFNIHIENQMVSHCRLQEELSQKVETENGISHPTPA